MQSTNNQTLLSAPQIFEIFFKVIKFLLTLQVLLTVFTIYTVICSFINADGFSSAFFGGKFSQLSIQKDVIKISNV